MLNRLVPMRVGGELCSALFFSLLMTSCTASHQPKGSELTRCGTTRVKDGDSVSAVCGKEKLEFRLACIDSPELSQNSVGSAAKKALAAELGDHFSANLEGIDRYGRTIATLWKEDREVNLALVRTGRSFVYPKYCQKSVYYGAEKLAKTERLGVWGGETEVVRPWVWRRR